VIDYWKLTKDFSPGDSVQKFMPGDPGGLSPFVGRVTEVLRGLGYVDVQWPFGVERVLPDEVVRINPDLQRYLPPTLNQSYSSYDTRLASGAKLWRTVEVPQGFHRDLARLWAKGASDVMAYDELWTRHTPLGADDEAIKDEVSKFYLAAANLDELRLRTHAHKTAAYWAAQNRQYRVTSDEVNARKPSCPKCGTRMRKTTYKMDQGARVRLWGCPKDLTLIKTTDLLGPGGEPVEW
jgi:ribosomal protein S27AE